MEVSSGLYTVSETLNQTLLQNSVLNTGLIFVETHNILNGSLSSVKHGIIRRFLIHLHRDKKFSTFWKSLKQMEGRVTVLTGFTLLRFDVSDLCKVPNVNPVLLKSM